MMKRFLSTVILAGLLTTQAVALQEKKRVSLTKGEREKMSQLIWRDIRKGKALKNFDSFLTKVIVLFALSAGAVYFLKACDIPFIPEFPDRLALVPYNQYYDRVGRIIQWKCPQTVRPFCLPALIIAGSANLIKIPVTLKRMRKEGYYAGPNPFKLFWHGLKFKTVDAWA